MTTSTLAEVGDRQGPGARDDIRRNRAELEGGLRNTGIDASENGRQEDRCTLDRNVDEPVREAAEPGEDVGESLLDGATVRFATVLVTDVFSCEASNGELALGFIEELGGFR